MEATNSHVEPQISQIVLGKRPLLIAAVHLSQCFKYMWMIKNPKFRQIFKGRLHSLLRNGIGINGKFSKGFALPFLPLQSFLFHIRWTSTQCFNTSISHRSNSYRLISIARQYKTLWWSALAKCVTFILLPKLSSKSTLLYTRRPLFLHLQELDLKG